MDAFCDSYAPFDWSPTQTEAILLLPVVSEDSGQLDHVYLTQ